MPPSELTPNYRADNNRGAQSCAAVCSRRKSGCRIAGCHAPFCRPRYYSPRPALSFNPSPPLSLGVPRLSKTFNDNSPPTPVYIGPNAPPFHSIPFRSRVTRSTSKTFDIRHGERDEISLVPRENVIGERIRAGTS